MKNYEIKNETYYSKDSVKVALVEQITVPVQRKETVFTTGGLKATIDFLKEKKAKFIEEIDAEILYNEQTLAEVEKLVADVEISESPAPIN